MNSRKEVEEIMGYEHSTYSIDICGIHLVLLGTYVNHKIGNAAGGILKTQFISIEDIKWLEEDLKKNKLPVLICTHFGIAEDDIPYYVVGPLTENIKDDGVPDGVYFIVEFDGENLEVIERHIGEDESRAL